MDEFIKTAIAEFGVKEIHVLQNKPTIVKYAKEAGFELIFG